MNEKVDSKHLLVQDVGQDPTSDKKEITQNVNASANKVFDEFILPATDLKEATSYPAIKFDP